MQDIRKIKQLLHCGEKGHLNSWVGGSDILILQALKLLHYELS